MTAKTDEYSRIITLPFKTLSRASEYFNLLMADEDSITVSNEYPTNIRPEEYEVGCDDSWRYLLPPEPAENFVEYTIKIG